MYNKIKNPYTNIWVNINSQLGKKIIRNYINYFLGGCFGDNCLGALTPEKITISDRIRKYRKRKDEMRIFANKYEEKLKKLPNLLDETINLEKQYDEFKKAIMDRHIHKLIKYFKQNTDRKESQLIYYLENYDKYIDDGKQYILDLAREVINEHREFIEEKKYILSEVKKNLQNKRSRKARLPLNSDTQRQMRLDRLGVNLPAGRDSELTAAELDELNKLHKETVASKLVHVQDETVHKPSIGWRYPES